MNYFSNDIQELKQRGLSNTQIAKELNTSTKHVNKCVREVLKGQSDKQTKELVIKYHLHGFSSRSIGEKVSLSHTKCLKIIRLYKEGLKSSFFKRIMHHLRLFLIKDNPFY
ncbi:hypothetical protein AVL50_32210 [Flammeovirga sp. SJP92]|nr:hypothetical protein AVL50_32210 [Flammeovirga sp. SJP92]